MAKIKEIEIIEINQYGEFTAMDGKKYIFDYEVTGDEGCGVIKCYDDGKVYTVVDLRSCEEWDWQPDLVKYKDIPVM